MAEGKGKEMQVEAWLEGREKRTKKGSMHGRRSGFKNGRGVVGEWTCTRVEKVEKQAG